MTDDHPTVKPTDAWVFLLPPGWARLPAGEGRERELDEAVEAVIGHALPADLPRDSAEPYRRLLRDRLRAGVGEAGSAGASAVYLPYAPVDGVIVPASIVEVELDADAGADPFAVVSSVLGDGYEESEVLEVDGRPAVRVVSTLHDVRREGDWPTVSSRQVLYAVSRDDVEGEWLVLSFNVVWNTPGSERLAEALVLFFDAVMSTFRWVGEGVGPDGTPPMPPPDLPGRAVPGSVPA